MQHIDKYSGFGEGTSALNDEMYDHDENTNYDMDCSNMIS